MGRKKGGKNPEGHRAGGARSGAGRPRKVGPLTLKSAHRVHGQQPVDSVLYVRRDTVHPAIRDFVDTPAHYMLQCARCTHNDAARLLVCIARPQLDIDLSVTTSAATSQFSRSQSPHVGTEHYTEPGHTPHLGPTNQHEESALFTPPASLSPATSQSIEPQDIPMDESTVVHAESLLLLSTPVQAAHTPTQQQPFDVQQQQEIAQASHADTAQQPGPPDHAQASQPPPHPNLMPTAHLNQSMTYNSACFNGYLQSSQTPTEPYDNASQAEPYQTYHSIPAQTEETYQNGPTATTITATATATSFQLDSSSSVQDPAQNHSYCHSPTVYQQQRAEYDRQQTAEYNQPNYYPQSYAPELYIQSHSHPAPHRPVPTKLNPVLWRHAPHSSSIPPTVAAILSSHSPSSHPSCIPANMDPSGPVHFLPTGQHSQRRRRRCVICINAGRGEDADRCSGRGNRNLCPWYTRHGSPDNIMDIRNPKDIRPTNLA